MQPLRGEWGMTLPFFVGSAEFGRDELGNINGWVGANRIYGKAIRVER
ncbi:MAG TPA: hypothetical protein VM680_13295 [Verrucomicrobiae bacterium]|nr:hypothetical protein [Verrucomicrobiae bacterium]